MTNQQIISLYETNNIAVQDIAENFELDIDMVKLALMSGSSKYRKLVKSKDETFDNDTVDYAKQVMTDLLDCEVENVKYRAARYVIDESKGRNDIKHIQNSNINVNLIISQQMQRAFEAANNAMKPTNSLSNNKVIDLLEN